LSSADAPFGYSFDVQAPDGYRWDGFTFTGSTRLSRPNSNAAVTVVNVSNPRSSFFTVSFTVNNNPGGTAQAVGCAPAGPNAFTCRSINNDIAGVTTTDYTITPAPNQLLGPFSSSGNPTCQRGSVSAGVIVDAAACRVRLPVQFDPDAANNTTRPPSSVGGEACEWWDPGTGINPADGSTYEIPGGPGYYCPGIPSSDLKYCGPYSNFPSVCSAGAVPVGLFGGTLTLATLADRRRRRHRNDPPSLTFDTKAGSP
jgi:hypothetical protein